MSTRPTRRGFLGALGATAIVPAATGRAPGQDASAAMAELVRRIGAEGGAPIRTLYDPPWIVRNALSMNAFPADTRFDLRSFLAAGDLSSAAR